MNYFMAGPGKVRARFTLREWSQPTDWMRLQRGINASRYRLDYYAFDLIQADVVGSAVI